MSNTPPKHIAIIMDGNGRWAKNKFLPRVVGHREGTKATKNIVKACGEIGVKFLTIYVFSSENWNRPEREVSALMKLLIEMIHKEVDELNDQNVTLQAMGQLHRLPPKTLEKLEWGIEKTKHNTGLCLNLALSYGGRQEIVDASIKMALAIKNNELDVNTVNEETFQKFLYKPEMPDPELLIRTGGDLRVSNYLLWEIAYTEIYITSTLWPDFSKDELLKAIESYQKRQRRFGKVLD